MACIINDDTLDHPQWPLSFVTICGGPSDVTAQAARRTVRAEAAKRSANQRRATIARRYGSKTNARYGNLRPGGNPPIRQFRLVETRVNRRRQNDAIPPVGEDGPLVPCLKSTSSESSGECVREGMELCQQVRLCDMPPLRDIKISWLCSQPLQPRLSSEQARSEYELAEQIAACTNGFPHVDRNQETQWTRTQRTQLPRMLPFAPNSLASHCFPDLVQEIKECDISTILPDVACVTNTSHIVDKNGQINNLTPDSYSHHSGNFPNVQGLWKGKTSPMPIGLAFLQNQRLLPPDLVKSVSRISNIDLDSPDLTSRIESAGIDLFSPKSYSPVSPFVDGLSEHICTYVRLAGGLILTILHEVATNGESLLPNVIQDGTMEEWCRHINVGSCMPVDTPYDDILLWAMSMIYITSGRLNETQWHLMRKLLETIMIDSFATFKGIIQRFGCPNFLACMLANLWEGITKSTA